MNPLTFKTKISIQGPMNQVYGFLTLDTHAKVLHTSHILSRSGQDIVNSLVYLTLSSTQAIKLLTHYKLQYKVLELDGYPTSCPLVEASLSGYKTQTEVSDDQS